MSTKFASDNHIPARVLGRSLRAAMVDVYIEIDANRDSLERFQGKPDLWDPSILSTDARARSFAHLRRGCSRETCRRVNNFYA
jgi:hypothetical protein